MKISKITFFVLLLVGLASPIFAKNELYCSVYATLKIRFLEAQKKDWVDCTYESLRGNPMHPAPDTGPCSPAKQESMERFKKLCLEG